MFSSGVVNRSTGKIRDTEGTAEEEEKDEEVVVDEATCEGVGENDERDEW